jgi:hypothetical protein
MKRNFTQGPWYSRPQGSEIEIKKGIYTICMVHNYNEPHEDNEANARLITAAPEMFEVIEELYKWAVDNKTFGPIFPKLQAAYQKATGTEEKVV